MNSEQCGFDQVALEWDTFAPRVKLIEEIGDHLLSEVALDTGEDVLDFGCGTGLLSLRMAPVVKSLTGADVSSGMLDVMMKKARDLELHNVSTLALDPEQCLLPKDAYDLIVGSMVMHHVEDLKSVLGQLFDALRPGGVALADLDPDDGLFHQNSIGVFHQGFERKDFASVMGGVGFSAVKVTDAAVMQKMVKGQSRDFGVFLAVGRKWHE